MSHENISLVVLSIVLCSLNVFLGPLSLRIAKFFGKSSTDTARERDEAEGEATETPLSRPSVVQTRAAR
jgi:hypothetical protein